MGYSAKDPVTRLEEHNVGLNKWTKENGPFELLYYERYFCEKDAREREKFYKTGFGREIKQLIVDRLKEIKAVV